MAYSIGVITLSRNQGAFLSEAVQSVLLQNPTSYVIYDCGSMDNSRAILGEIHEVNVRKVFVDSDGGPSDGLNSALDLLNCDIFYYLNADDFVNLDAFEYVKNYFELNPDCDILHGSINIVDKNGVVSKTLPAMNFSLVGYALGYSFVYQQATFIRRSILGESPFNLENRISWDGELIVDLVLAGAEIHQTQKILGNFRIYSESITGSGKFKTLAKIEHSRITRKILGHDVRPWEKLFGAAIRYARAMHRKLFPKIC